MSEICIKNIPGWGVTNRNLGGDPKKDKFGSPAKKFSLCLTRESHADAIDELVNAGIRVKEWFSEEHQTMNYYVNVKVGKYARIIVKPIDGDPVEISPESFDTVDDILIDEATLIVGTSEWDMNGRAGVTLYLNEMFIRQGETERDKAYAEWLNG